MRDVVAKMLFAIVMFGGCGAVGQEKHKVEVPPAVLNELNSGKAEYKAADLEAYAVDLNGDGNPEIAVVGRLGSSLCGARNCPLWIFQSTGSRYVELLRHHRQHDGDVLDGEVSAWNVLPSRTHGYHDLEFYFSDTPTTATVTRYRMRDGKYEYVPGSCAAVIYGYFDKSDKYHEYKPEKSEPCGGAKAGR